MSDYEAQHYYMGGKKEVILMDEQIDGEISEERERLWMRTEDITKKDWMDN